MSVTKPIFDVQALTDQALNSDMDVYKSKIMSKLKSYLNNIKSAQDTVKLREVEMKKFQDEVDSCMTEAKVKDLCGRWGI